MSGRFHLLFWPLCVIAKNIGFDQVGYCHFFRSNIYLKVQKWSGTGSDHFSKRHHVILDVQNSSRDAPELMLLFISFLRLHSLIWRSVYRQEPLSWYSSDGRSSEGRQSAGFSAWHWCDMKMKSITYCKSPKVNPHASLSWPPGNLKISPKIDLMTCCWGRTAVLHSRLIKLCMFLFSHSPSLSPLTWWSSEPCCTCLPTPADCS